MAQIQNYWIIPLSHNILMQMLQSDLHTFPQRNTVEPRLMATLVTWSPHYYSHFFWPCKTAIRFLIKKPSPIWSTVNTANGHILKSKNSRIFYNFTLLILPLARNFEYWNACDMSIPMFLVSWACICTVLRPVVTDDAFCDAQMPIFTSVLCTEGNFQVVCTIIITLCVF